MNKNKNNYFVNEIWVHSRYDTLMQCQNSQKYLEIIHKIFIIQLKPPNFLDQTPTFQFWLPFFSGNGFYNFCFKSLVRTLASVWYLKFKIWMLDLDWYSTFESWMLDLVWYSIFDYSNLNVWFSSDIRILTYKIWMLGYSLNDKCWISNIEPILGCWFRSS